MADKQQTNEAADLRIALAKCVQLLEAWAYGPIVAAGVRWPDGVCRAPALVQAKSLLAQGVSDV